jgi:hypothetical protein
MVLERGAVPLIGTIYLTQECHQEKLVRKFFALKRQVKFQQEILFLVITAAMLNRAFGCEAEYSEETVRQ